MASFVIGCGVFVLLLLGVLHIGSGNPPNETCSQILADELRHIAECIKRGVPSAQMLGQFLNLLQDEGVLSCLSAREKAEFRLLVPRAQEALKAACEQAC